MHANEPVCEEQEEAVPHHILTIAHQVARITLHNPPANVLNLSMLKELEEVLNQV